MAQHPVAQFKHVLEVRVSLIPQILQLQHGAVAALAIERSLEDAEDLGRQNGQIDPLWLNMKNSYKTQLALQIHIG